MALSGFSSALLQVSADDAQTALNEVGERAPALVEAWVGAANAAAIQQVAEHGSGKIRTAARRGLNVLKARGVPIPPRQRSQRTVQAPNEPVQAWLLAPDTNGVWLIVIARRLANAAYRACFVYLLDENAVLEIGLRELSQSRLAESLRGALRGQAYEAVKVPPAWARQVVNSARATQKERGLLEPLGFRSAADLLEPLPEEEHGHPFDDEGLELAEEDARQLAQNSARLHQLPEFRGWLPDRTALGELVAKVGERMAPGEQPTQEALTSYVQEEVLAATDRYFTPERRQQLVSRLKHGALSVLSREGEAQALEISAVTEVVKQAGLITHPPRDIPFLTAFFEKGLAMLMAEKGGRLEIPVAAPTPAAAAAEGV